MEKNKYLVYSLLDFHPLKNRDYYIIFEFAANEKENEYFVEWYPAGEEYKNTAGVEPTKKIVRVKNIYGRWKIKNADNKIKVSVEYHNDFELNIPKQITASFEKKSTVEALNNLISHTMAEK
jgi:hypothetical protein